MDYTYFSPKKEKWAKCNLEVSLILFNLQLYIYSVSDGVKIVLIMDRKSHAL